MVPALYVILSHVKLLILSLEHIKHYVTLGSIALQKLNERFLQIIPSVWIT